MSTNKKIAILGIGQAGCRTVSEIHSLRQAENFTIFAVDTDEHSLAECSIPEQNKLLAGANWRYGQGCGGNAMAGSRAISSSRTQMENMQKMMEQMMAMQGNSDVANDKNTDKTENVQPKKAGRPKKTQ